MMTAMFYPEMLAVDSYTWLEVLLFLSVKGLLVLLIAAGLSFALRKASAAARHLVWSLALASLLALPVLTFFLPSLEVPILPLAFSAERSERAKVTSASQAQEMEPVAAPKQSPTGGARRQSISAPSWPVMTIESEDKRSEAKAESLGWAAWALLVWLAGAVLILCRLLIGTASVWWMARGARRISDDQWLVFAERLALRLRLARQATLFKSRSATMPLTFGVVRSSILLPADADDWSDERREVVLLHELAHVKRRDCLTQMLAQIACAIYWFNPLIWAAARRLRVERERACDDQVLDAGTKASDYADHLLDIARRLKASNCSSLAAVAIARRSQLEGRLLAILDPNVRRRGLSRIASIAVGLAVASIALPLASLRPSAQAQARHFESAESKALANEQSRTAFAEVVKLNSQQTQNQKVASESGTAPAPLPQETSALYGEAVFGESLFGGAPAPQPAQPGQNDQSPQPKPQPAPTPATEQERDSAAEALSEALKDEDAEVREHALFALAQIGGSRATEALVEALKDANPQAREKAVLGLAMRHSNAVIDPLIGALRDSNTQVREKAAWALGMNGNGRAIEPLSNALKDEDVLVREKAAWALGLRGDNRAVEPLINALNDSSSQVRGMAAWALGLKGDKRAMKALSAAMKDQNKDVRGKAAWALGMLLMRSGESATDDNDRDRDEDVDVDFGGSGSGSGSGNGNGTGVGKGKGIGIGTGAGNGKGVGSGIGTGKAKARP